jgi:hypothetical protein
MKIIARLTFRPTTDGKSDLILGSCFKGQNIFKGNDVWQVEEILGELVLKKIGKSPVGETAHNTLISELCWMNSADDILERGGKHIFLTQEEYKKIKIDK